MNRFSPVLFDCDYYYKMVYCASLQTACPSRHLRGCFSLTGRRPFSNGANRASKIAASCNQKSANLVGMRSITTSSESISPKLKQKVIEYMDETEKSRQNHERVQLEWKKNRFCPECGKSSVVGQRSNMADFCPTLWRKYMKIDDRYCPLYAHARVCESGEDPNIRSSWDRMPKIKGLS